MDHNPESGSLTGTERSIMIKAKTLKSLACEHRLRASELRTLKRETQNRYVLQRKEVLAEEVEKMEDEISSLHKELQKLLESGSDELNPDGKYYRMAKKLVVSA